MDVVVAGQVAQVMYVLDWTSGPSHGRCDGRTSGPIIYVVVAGQVTQVMYVLDWTSGPSHGRCGGRTSGPNQVCCGGRKSGRSHGRCGGRTSGPSHVRFGLDKWPKSWTL